MQHYFIEKRIEGKFYFTNDDIHHIRNVMRFHSGDKVIGIIDSKKYLLSLHIDKEIIGELVEELDNISNNLNINLIIALPKGDKFDLILQKCTELGVSKIIPFMSEHSLVRIDSKDYDKKITRWNKIVKEASEQSERLSLPVICNPCYLKDLDKYFTGQVLLCDERLGREKGTKLIDAVNNSEVTLIVGPEGGFSSKEFEMFEKLGAISVSLGKRILRCETAAIISVGLVASVLEK